MPPKKRSAQDTAAGALGSAIDTPEDAPAAPAAVHTGRGPGRRRHPPGDQDPAQEAAAPSPSKRRRQGVASPRPGPHAVEAEDALPARNSDLLMESVVKVFCAHTEPNFSLPWQRKRQYASSGSGFIIEGRRILTNAHCCEHHTQVKVKRRGSDTKYVANVLSVGAECDIAMLTVEDPLFWKDLQPVAFGELPRLQDSITVVGYPVGGDTMSVTQGVVSRIEVTSYVHGAAELLGIQVDAAINSGNSGGPAFNEHGQCVGIAFQSLRNEDVENISYVIPTPVINHFISDYHRHGRYTGFPVLGAQWQNMESPALRASLGMDAAASGALVRRIDPTGSCAGVLSPGDVLLAFDGVIVGSDLTVPFRRGERISFSYLVSQKMTGDKAVLKILSNGAVKEVELQLKASQRLIPVHINGHPPSYYIFGGLLFTPATIPFLRSEYGKDFDYEAPVRLMAKLDALPEVAGQQVVVLSQVLAAEANVGYEDIINTQVLSVNGRKINCLADVLVAVEASSDRFLTIALANHQVVVLDKAEAEAATEEVLAQHCIPSDRSADLSSAAAAAAGGAATAAGGAVDGPAQVKPAARPRKTPKLATKK